MCAPAKAEVLITGLQPGIILLDIQGQGLLQRRNITGPVPAALIAGPDIADLLQVAEVLIQGHLPAAVAKVLIQDLQVQGVVLITVRPAARKVVIANLQAAQAVEVTVLLQGVQGAAVIVHLQEAQGAAAVAVTAVLQVVLPEAVAEHAVAAAQDRQVQEAEEDDNINISFTGPAISGIFF